jgi:hypothetical protein
MDDVFALYEQGLRCLQAQFSSEEELFYDLATYKSRLLISTRNLRRYGEDNPTEKAHLLQVIHQLHHICGEKFGMDFEDWCAQCAVKELCKMQQDSLYPYVGDWQALQDGRLQQFLRESLAQQGIKLQTNRIPPREDPIERYRKVPLHAYLLYSSQDLTIAPYITKHWDALEGLSRDVYDLYVSFAELNHAEDGHDAIETSYVLKKTGFSAYSLLPGILFWDKQWNWEFVPFGDQADDRSMTYIWRLLYEHLKKEPAIRIVSKVKALLQRASPSDQRHDFPYSPGGMNYSLIEESLEQYRNASILSLVAQNTAPVTRSTTIASDGLSQKYIELINELKHLPTGNGLRYEALVEKILRLCFEDEFEPFILVRQSETHNKKRRRDFIIDNVGSKIEFWQHLKFRRGVEKIVFDAKNYKDRLSYSQIAETLRYLRNPAFGNFMIFISRHGLKDLEEVLEDYDKEQRVTLFLNDADVIAMIERKQSGETASSFIWEKYSQFLTWK